MAPSLSEKFLNHLQHPACAHRMMSSLLVSHSSHTQRGVETLGET